jgi:alpha-ketoglutarate-dependent taurine dioxygenase
MSFRWYEYLSTTKRAPDGTVLHEYLFPGEETPSAVADQLVEEFRALETRMHEKYGPDQWELPFDEWVIWRGLLGRASAFPDAEQRYMYRCLSGYEAEK